VKKDFVIIGGLAKNPGIIDWLESILKVSRLAPKPEWDSTLTAALGAALFADAFYRRQQSDTSTTAGVVPLNKGKILAGLDVGDETSVRNRSTVK
jgi:hypothetical protein